jgi:hypothetical protein
LDGGLPGVAQHGKDEATSVLQHLHGELSDRTCDGFVTAVRAVLPRGRKWSAAEIARLKQEYADTLIPARDAATDILALERKLSDLVNAAYGLTPDEVALMWRRSIRPKSFAVSAPSRHIARPTRKNVNGRRDLKSSCAGVHRRRQTSRFRWLGREGFTR